MQLRPRMINPATSMKRSTNPDIIALKENTGSVCNSFSPTEGQRTVTHYTEKTNYYGRSN